MIVCVEEIFMRPENEARLRKIRAISGCCGRFVSAFLALMAIMG